MWCFTALFAFTLRLTLFWTLAFYQISQVRFECSVAIDGGDGPAVNQGERVWKDSFVLCCKLGFMLFFLLGTLSTGRAMVLSWSFT